MFFERDAPARNPFHGWAIIVVTLLLVILAPFLLFEGAVLDAAERALDPVRPRLLTGIAVIVLLASDIVLPVPSSVVSTGAGSLLGFLWGTVASSIGMTLGCLAGYVIGYRYGRRTATVVVGATQIARAEATVLAFGALALLILRPVPVLAEASVISAGALRVPFTRVCVSVSAANIALSAWYAGFGAAADQASVVFVFLGALLLPASALLVQLFFRRSTRSDTQAVPGRRSVL
jgi:uncharacterized membrane protein YdjX (TVP38/TMEM64 family)